MIGIVGEECVVGMGRPLGDGVFGAVVIGGAESGGTCANGLPMAPGSVRMIGRMSRLQEVERHSGLVRHLALVRCTTGEKKRGFVERESYRSST